MTIRFAIISVLLGIVLLGSVAPASADDCAAPTPIASVALLPGNDFGSRFLVPVSIDGTPRTLMLDTGGGFTSLTAGAADALGLARRESNGRLLDLAGHASRDYVQVQTLHIDALALDQLGSRAMNLWITPMPGLGDGAMESGGVGFDGILAGDLLMHYDVDIDFPARRMTVFSQGHCPGDVVVRPGVPVAVVPFLMQAPDADLPGRRRPLSSEPDTHIRVPVTLDGKRFLAVVDTGALNSTISARTAREAFGVDIDTPGSLPLGMIDNEPSHRLFVRRFSRLAFEGVAVLNPRMVVIPDLVGARDPDNRTIAGSRVRRVDDGLSPPLTIGMDVLKHMDLYIGFQERKLYISLPDAPIAAASAAKAPPLQ